MTVTLQRHGAIAVVRIDNPPVNAVSHAVRQALMDAVAQTESDAKIGAVVLACAGRTFVAGADVKEFDAPPVEPHLPDVIAAIEAADTPWVAALHGTALGGGLEIAMGCHYRIADPKARMGLPEVTLGLVPGAGGTVRLPRLVSADLAVAMVAGGKPITARAALDAGLVDALAEGDLLEAALAFAETRPEPRRTLDLPVVGKTDPEAFDKIAANLRRKARGQSSVAIAVEALERGLTLPPAEALAEERATFLSLKTSDQARGLRHIFFAERATLADPRTKIEPRALTHIGVVGGGTMGAGIASLCLMRGLSVTLIERDDVSVEAGAERVRATLEGSANRGLLNDLDGAWARFQSATDYNALAEADLVIEAVFEDMSVKKEVFAGLDAATKPDAILATNTSYLDVNDIAACLKDPSRAIGLHFFSPAHIMKLLEIVLPDAVADDVVATAARLSKSLGKIGVFSGVCDGFIGNRIMSSYRSEADRLLLDGAWPSEVDAAMRTFGFPMGIFEMQDLAGLDIAWAMRKRRRAEGKLTGNESRIADRLCEEGRFGRKTNGGWYDYVDGRAQPSQHVAKVIDEERDAERMALSQDDIVSRILGALRREAEALLEEGIARSADDIDVVMVNGYGFPRWTGGPMFSAWSGS
ncbi:3-hydroxyacyl-CoA dehydrogenase NAD-binding domain-containing protein [Marivita sp. XM-24bin2]|jgi:3-hydroxyacyl-CoA dehydrogenase|uniref:3-hydroxyacyl-CoA dehydrogenase NAD-binding domain-containing protein n=1 Tax=unclassified Marivita TaxID=2632480 RepID=UPI000D7AF18F|nr:3-hydroxyacyl-CoA dehydrogenase NAD-binding domain-containing protein [Marivita sp. XM-24bin2]MCR9107353.1 3-hydroxyacyl-CoA dehydrogenase NAD-binding domain-containing protein [Paracoccaceae bacterium]PWL36528.1 MAG: 3-hydroxyacyl-CoA dehydrogenase [Marivita sp. XM-24bin2]